MDGNYVAFFAVIATRVTPRVRRLHFLVADRNPFTAIAEHATSQSVVITVMLFLGPNVLASLIHSPKCLG